MLQTKTFIFTLLLLCAALNVCGQDLVSTYCPVYKLHISTPKENWSYKCYPDSFKGLYYPMEFNVFFTLPNEGERARKNDVSILVTVSRFPDTAYQRFMFYWAYTRDSTFENACITACRDKTINDSVKSFVMTTRPCRSHWDRDTKPEKMIEFLYPHNGRCFLLTCYANPRNFKKYEALFYRVAQSVSFD